MRAFVTILMLFCCFGNWSYAADYDEDLSAYHNIAALVVNSNDGTVIFEQNSQEQRYPASLTKLMTMYVAFDKISKGQISFSDKIHVKRTPDVPAMKIGIQKGDVVSVQDMVYGMIVHSANDAAEVLGEYVGETKDGFVVMMNNYAHQLKMYSTNFVNPSGLHSSMQFSTARDMAKLAVAVQKNFPEYFDMFLTKKFEFKGKTYNNHNRIVANYDGATGLKTGYIAAGGYSIISTAKKDGTNVVAVVMSAKNLHSRDAIVARLLDYGYGYMYQNNLYTSSVMPSLGQIGEDVGATISANAGTIG